jgi:hypothetical protein
MPQHVSEHASVAWFNADHPDVEGAGFYVLEGTPVKDDNTEHHTGMSPGRRVYPHPDGEGWTYSPTAMVDGELRVTNEDEEEETDNG